jgi:hypothetical protein
VAAVGVLLLLVLAEVLLVLVFVPSGLLAALLFSACLCSLLLSALLSAFGGCVGCGAATAAVAGFDSSASICSGRSMWYISRSAFMLSVSG